MLVKRANVSKLPLMMRGSVATVDGIPVTTPEILNDSDDEIKDLK